MSNAKTSLGKRPVSKKKKKSKGDTFKAFWSSIIDPVEAFWKSLRQSSETYRVVHDEIENQKLAKLLAKTDWTKISKAKAVEIYEYRLQLRIIYNLTYGKDDPRSQIPCPVEFETLILEAALQGMHKGESKNKRPPNRYMKNFWITLMQANGRDLKANLIADGMKADDAGMEAAEYVVEELAQRFNIKTISPETMEAMLKRRPKFQSVRRFLTPDI
jgi:hypothetical protein